MVRDWQVTYYSGFMFTVREGCMGGDCFQGRLFLAAAFFEGGRALE